MKTKPILLAVLSVAAVVVLSVLSVALWGEKPEKTAVHEVVIPDAQMTPAQIARSNDIPLKPVLKALGVDTAGARTATIAGLGISAGEAAAKIKRSLIEYEEHLSKNWIKIFIKFGLWFLILPIPFVLMFRKRLSPTRRKLLAGLGVVIFGVALGADPSPMGTVKDAVFLISAHGTVFPPRIIALGIFLLTVVVANKFICSWGCQFGLLQEFLFRLNRRKTDRRGQSKQYKPPFWLSNSIRVAVFAAFTAVGVLWAFDFIGYVDPFKIFNPAVMTVAGIGFVLIVLALSLFVYRPWCHFACPFGLVSWLFEKLAIFRIKVDYNKCIACDACAVTCPSTVMSAILKKDKRTVPDCFACGVCIETCPTDAVSFTASRKPQGSYELAQGTTKERRKELLVMYGDQRKVTPRDS